MDCTLKSPTITSRQMAHSKKSNSTKTSNLKAFDTSSNETSSVTHHPNAQGILNHVSDDPSAPIYPPRSPTSDIVPKELQPFHWRQYPGIPHFSGNDETPIDQLDGSIENIEDCSVGRLFGSSRDSKVAHENCGAKSLLLVSESENLGGIGGLLSSHDESLQENDDILALIDKSKGLSNSRHSSSSSSVSSIGSSSSLSLRESMSDTVSVQSYNSSGYGSEHFENTAEYDYNTGIKSHSNNPKKPFKKCYVSDYTHKNYITFGPQSFGSFVDKSYANSKNQRDKINDGMLYKFSSPRCNNQLSNVYEYHEGNLIPIACENINFRSRNMINVGRKYLNDRKRDNHPKQGEYVSTIEKLLENTQFKDVIGEY